MGDGVGTVELGRLHEVLHDHRPGQGGHQRIAVLVQGVGGQGGSAVLRGVLLLGVHDDGLDGSGGPGPLLDDVVVLARLADVGGQGDHLDAHLIDHPTDGDRRVETAAVGEDDALGHGGSFFLGIRPDRRDRRADGQR